MIIRYVSKIACFNMQVLLKITCVFFVHVDVANRFPHKKFANLIILPLMLSKVSTC